MKISLLALVTSLAASSTTATRLGDGRQLRDDECETFDITWYVCRRSSIVVPSW